MTFNQWCAGNNFDSSLRLAFEGVWNAMVAGCSPGEAGSLLTDLARALPYPCKPDIFAATYELA